jgi:hypothetical protein
LSRGSALDRGNFLLHLLAVSLTLGSAVFFAAAVAPASFRVLPSRALAGDLTGAVLSSLCGMQEVCFAVLFATTWRLTRGQGPSRAFPLLRRVPVLGFFCALTIRSLIVPAAERIRRSLPAGTDLSAADPLLRQRFARLHGASVSLLLLDVVCALALLALASRFLSRGPELPSSGRPAGFAPRG